MSGLNPEVPNIVPAYTIEVLPSSYVTERQVYRYMTEKDGTRTRKVETVKESGGYLVKTPRSGSVRVRSKRELREMNIDGMPAMVHLESGEKVPLHKGQYSVSDQLEHLEEMSDA